VSALSEHARGEGRNDSRNLIFRFIFDCIEVSRLSPMMLRDPRARGPKLHAAREPADDLSCDMRSETRSSSSASSYTVNFAPRASSACLHSPVDHLGPAASPSGSRGHSPRAACRATGYQVKSAVPRRRRRRPQRLDSRWNRTGPFAQHLAVRDAVQGDPPARARFFIFVWS